MTDNSYETYLESCGVDPIDIPADLRALYELDGSESAFFWYPDYGEVELLTEWPSGADHYIDSAHGDAWRELFDDILWVGAEADGGLIGYYQPETLDQVIYLDNEGSIRTTGRRLVDHFAWYNFDDEQPELAAFCDAAGLAPPHELTDAERADFADPEDKLNRLLEELRQAPTPEVRPLDRAPQAVALADGRILVVSNDDELADTEYDSQATFVFEPDSLTCSRLQDTPFKAYLSGSIPGVLADGRVPYVSVDRATRLALFDPTDDDWTDTEELDSNHEQGTAVLLEDGRIFVLGPYGSVDVYDGDEGAWTTTTDLPNGRKDIQAVVLADGRVLTVGGTDFSYMPVDTCDLYDPEDESWAPAAALPEPMDNMALQLLPDDRVLMVRGQRYALYDPDADRWTDISNLPGGGETMVLLEDGRVALFGHGGRAVACFDPETDEVSEMGELSLPRDRSSQAVALPDGRVLLVGGTLYNNIASEPEVWDPNTGESTALPGFEGAFEKQKKALAKRE